MAVPALPEVQRVEPDDEGQRKSNACRNTGDDTHDAEGDEPRSEGSSAEPDVFCRDDFRGGLIGSRMMRHKGDTSSCGRLARS